MDGPSDDWSRYEGKTVVVDTNSNFLYIGTLRQVTDHWIELGEVDVHDRSETPTTKEKYIMDAKRYGVKVNRKGVAVRKVAVVSLSLLSDVVEY